MTREVDSLIAFNAAGNTGCYAGYTTNGTHAPNSRHGQPGTLSFTGGIGLAVDFDALGNDPKKLMACAKHFAAQAPKLFELFHTPLGFCVPLDTEILTRGGWKRWHEVQNGEETVGYNPETGTSEWTKITDVHFFESQPVVELSRRGWSARTTSGHRWYGERRRGTGRTRRWEPGFFTTEEISVTSRLLLAAPVVDLYTPEKVSPKEAAILGWLMTDGHVTTNWPDGRCVSAVIYQSKAHYIELLRALLSDVLHTETVRKQRKDWLPAHQFFISPAWAAELMDRSGIAENGIEAFVLSLTDEARKSFLEACWHAEGSTLMSGAKTISQNEGPVLDAIRLAMYLEGIRPGYADATSLRSTKRHVVAAYCTPTITGERIKKRDVGMAPVWCPQTVLGTWTMRQGDQIMLTGNSIKNGKVVKWTIDGHADHVHVAVNKGVLLVPPVIMPSDVATKEEAMTLVIEPQGVAERPQHDGGWAFGRRGHVYAFGQATYLGGWDDNTRSGDRHCVALVGTKSGAGYFLVSNHGETFAYGDARYPGNYLAKWGEGVIIGAFGNDNQSNGGLTLLRDDGKRLNTYALPDPPVV